MPRAPTGQPALGELDAKTAARLVGAASDIALVLDDQGTIVDVMSQNAELGARGTPVLAGPALGADRHDREPAEGRGPAARRAVGGRRHRALAPGQPPGAGRRRPAAAVFGGAPERPPGPRAPRAASSPSAATCAPWWRCSGAWSTRSRRWSATTGASARPRPATATCSRPRRRRCSSSTAPTQKVLEANPAARALCGGTRAKLVGATLSALFDAGHAERAAEPAGRRARSVGPPGPDARAGWPAAARSRCRPRSSARTRPPSCWCAWRRCTRTAPARPGRAAAPPQAPRRPVDEAMLRAFVQSSPDGAGVLRPRRQGAHRQPRLPRRWPSSAPRSRRAARRSTAGSAAPASSSAC